MDAISNRSVLIEYLYRVAVEPSRYDELMNAWDRVLNEAIDESTDVFSDVELERHIDQASNILERLEASVPPPAPLSQSIRHDPNPAMLVDAGGAILAANDRAVERFGIQPGDNISSFETEEGCCAPLIAGLGQLSDTGMPNENGLLGLVKIRNVDDNAATMLAFSCVRCMHNGAVAGLVTTLAPVWSPYLAQALRRLFDLTSTETDVVHGFVTGQSLNQIARTRNRSVHTIRTQMKSILRKSGLDSQVDLVRLTGFLDRFKNEESAGSELSASVEAGEIKRSIILSTKMAMNYSIIGPPDGHPVLFVHGMLDSPELTKSANSLLYRHKIRLITPQRPSFGSSDPDIETSDMPARFAGYAEELLDALKIGRLPVIGHMAGSIYAVAIAARLGKRISGVLNIAGGVPIISNTQIKAMPPRQRLIALTTIHAPQLLPMFLKAGIALMRNGGENAFLNALYKGSPVDFGIARQPEARGILNRGYGFATRQGYGAFETDARYIVSDWSALMEKVHCPLICIHGVHDPVVKIEAVEDFCERYDNVSLRRSSKSGQLVLINDPALVFDSLAALL